MSKKTKKELISKAAASDVAAPSTPSETTQPLAKKPTVRKSVTRKTASGKKPSAAATKQTARKTTPKPSGTSEPSDADIRLRAYFIAERRVQLALQGDPANDWLAAKRELLQEAQQRQF